MYESVLFQISYTNQQQTIYVNNKFLELIYQVLKIYLKAIWVFMLS